MREGLLKNYSRETIVAHPDYESLAKPLAERQAHYSRDFLEKKFNCHLSQAEVDKVNRFVRETAMPLLVFGELFGFRRDLIAATRAKWLPPAPRGALDMIVDARSDRARRKFQSALDEEAPLYKIEINGWHDIMHVVSHRYQTGEWAPPRYLTGADVPIAEIEAWKGELSTPLAIYSSQLITNDEHYNGFLGAHYLKNDAAGSQFTCSLDTDYVEAELEAARKTLASNEGRVDRYSSAYIAALEACDPKEFARILDLYLVRRACVSLNQITEEGQNLNAQRFLVRMMQEKVWKDSEALKADPPQKMLSLAGRIFNGLSHDDNERILLEIFMEIIDGHRFA